MRSLRAAVPLALVASMIAAPTLAQDLDVVAYRFWRAPDHTLVEAFARVPWPLLEFEQEGERRVARFEAAYEVRDSSGLVLTRGSWADSVVSPPLADASLARASSLRHVRFALAPGRYTLHFELLGDDDARIAAGVADLVAPATRPSHSDLVLAASFDAGRGEGDAPARGAIRRGELDIVPNLAGMLPADQARLGLFIEVYDEDAGGNPAHASILIEGVDTDFSYRSPPQPRELRANAGEAFAVDLEGLPPGAYRLTAEWATAGDTLRATHALRILEPGAGVAMLPGEEVYADFGEAALDSIFAPMRLIASPMDEAEWLTLDGAGEKRRFLAGFWAARSARTGIGAAVLRADWEQRLAFVQLNYRTARRGHGDTAAWQTDRGRVYLTYGPPAETYVEAQRTNDMHPWEMWRYTSGRGDLYVFHDRSGFGDYYLVYSTNPEVLEVPGWQNYFSEDALRRIAMW